MVASPDCPKCSSAMEAGFIADQAYEAAGVETWVEGLPVKSFWTGIKLSGRERMEVTTYRCSRCGFLESYADRS